MQEVTQAENAVGREKDGPGPETTRREGRRDRAGGGKAGRPVLEPIEEKALGERLQADT